MGKKIGFVSAQYVPHMGGVENFTYHLARELANRGHMLTVLTSKYGQEAAREEMGGIHVIRIPTWGLMEGRFPIVKPGSECALALQELKAMDLDYVFINTQLYALSLVGAWFAKKNRISCALIEHGTAHITLASPFASKLGRIYEHMLTFAIKRCCKVFYGVSQASCEWLAHFHIQARGVIYNAVDEQAINAAIKGYKKDIRNEYQIGNDTLIVAFLGRVVPEKGIVQLVQAANLLEKENVALLVMGTGPLEKQLSKRCGKNIRFLGRTAHEEAMGILSQCDCLCLPSDAEGFSTVVLEAAMAGAYVIATANGGTKEFLRDNEFGMVLADNRAESLYAALLSAKENKERNAIVAKRAKEEVKRHYTWTNTADAVEALLEGK